MSATRFLRKNKTTIELILSGDRLLILGKCLENDLITERDYNNLKRINSFNEEQHVIELVDKIRNKSDETCEKFLDLLQGDEELTGAFPRLQKLMLKETPSLSEPEQETTSTAKAADGVGGSKPKRQKDDDDDDDDDERYPLMSKPTGLCFIINNVNFKDDDNPRLGSDADAERLAKVFSWLGFRVLMSKDQTMAQMDEVLTYLSSASDISKLMGLDVKEWSGSKFTDLKKVPAHGDAFICCILTHGERGVVCGVDWECLRIKEIKKMFKATAVSPLTTKPKVFLIQACQGGEHHGRLVLSDVQSDDPQSDDRRGGGRAKSIPVLSDFLIGMSTVEDYKSYRDELSGSWYIQTVCEKMEAGCKSDVDMYTILRRANKGVSKLEGWVKEKNKPGVWVKQMPEIRSTLTNDLVFSPQ